MEWFFMQLRDGEVNPRREGFATLWNCLQNRRMAYPDVKDTALVGTYPARAGAGGGYVWDAVLEYRVWATDEEGDYFRAFATHAEALAFSKEVENAEDPLALVLQEEYIDEPEPGSYVHVKERRVTEWPPEFLSRPRRTPDTIPDFLSPDAPENRLDILRGKG